MFSVVSDVSMFLSLVLFIRKAGRYTNSSLLSERFRWREKQLRDGLSGLFPNWLKDPCCLHNFLFRFVELRPSFTATPPDPFYVLEGNNITFVWQYNLSGTFDRVVFRFSSSPSRTIVFKKWHKPRRKGSRKCLPGSHSRKYQCYTSRNYNLWIAEIWEWRIRTSSDRQFFHPCQWQSDCSSTV